MLLVFAVGSWIYTITAPNPPLATAYVEFIINRKKRTVVCMLRDLGRNRVCSRGIAKCAPGDVFNSHIGRAIALRRALGLKVPAEYLSVPNPTEFKVGDIVIRYTLGKYYAPVLHLSNRHRNGWKVSFVFR
ncbi:hypothetical protein [Paenibacillus larvae]|uniref:hypothetical protein n=1 Tax=Paenibacillus larvae TaxID=1464 RepID=UPI00289075E0|nr:hypothetical protein [Paenibacillus larvae]MDT2232918.1 hypothetical protein [Paenibacillus larvae]